MDEREDDERRLLAFHLDAEGRRIAGPSPAAVRSAALRRDRVPKVDLVSGPVESGQRTAWLSWEETAPAELVFTFWGCMPRYAAANVSVLETDETVSVGIVSGISA